MPRLPRISAASRLALPSMESVRALDLLVVLELGLEQPDQLDREARGAGDADRGELVGREDLLDVALGDDVAHRGPPVAGHHHAAREGRGDDRGAVRGELGGVTRRAAAGGRAAGRAPGRPGSRRTTTCPAAGRRPGAGGRRSDRERHSPPFWMNDFTKSSALVSSTSSISSRIASTSSSRASLRSATSVSTTSSVVVLRLRWTCAAASAPGPWRQHLAQWARRISVPATAQRVSSATSASAAVSQRSSSSPDVRLGAAQRVDASAPAAATRGPGRSKITESQDAAATASANFARQRPRK